MKEALSGITRARLAFVCSICGSSLFVGRRNRRSQRGSLRHQPKSWMREDRASGSVRSAGRQRPAFA
jgi:hypothetical protein